MNQGQFNEIQFNQSGWGTPIKYFKIDLIFKKYFGIYLIFKKYFRIDIFKNQ